MSEKRPASYYITSREGAIWAKFAEHGRDVAARRVVPHTLANKASVSYLTELTDERRDKMDDRVTQALFNGGEWGARNPVAGGNEVMRLRSVNLADLKITPAQFKDSVRRIFAVMGVTPAQIGFDSFGPMQMDVKIRDSVYRENLHLMIESREYAAARRGQEAPPVTPTGVSRLPVRTNKIEENLGAEEAIADQQVAGILIEPQGEWLLREYGKRIKNTRYLSIDCDDVGLTKEGFEQSTARVLQSIGVDMQHVRFNYPDAEYPNVVEVEMPAWLYSVHRRALEGDVPERGR